MCRVDESNDFIRLYKEDGQPSEFRFANSLGAGIPSLRELGREIWSDMDESARGVKWWTSHISDWRTRALISDYLYVCTDSLETNLVEAILHAKQVKYWEGRQAKEVNRGKASPEPPFFNHPRPRRPADEMPEKMAELHILGAARAIASTLDCLAGAIAGVLPLPLKDPLSKAAFSDVRTKVTSVAMPGLNDAGKVQAEFRRVFEGSFQAAGPTGWSEWASDFRNMLVHRGRRLWAVYIEPKGGKITVKGDKAFATFKTAKLLPLEPSMSDIEAFREAKDRRILLAEPAVVTLEGLIKSTTMLVSDTTKALCDVWRARRNDPSMLPQPASHWKSGPKRKSGFEGYAPVAGLKDFNVIIGNPQFGQRLLIAGLDAKSRPDWDKLAIANPVDLGAKMANAPPGGRGKLGEQGQAYRRVRDGKAGTSRPMPVILPSTPGQGERKPPSGPTPATLT